MYKLKRLCAALAFSLSVCCAAWGLDVNDISQLIRSGVDDAVIINMVRSNKLSAPLNANDVVLLNASGASDTLLHFLTGPDASLAGTAVPSTTADSSTSYVDGGDTFYYIDEYGNYVPVTPEYTTVAPSTTYYYDDGVYDASVYPGTSYYYDYPDYTYGYSYPVYGGFYYGSGSGRPGGHRPPSSSHKPGRPGSNRPKPPSGSGSRPGGGRPPSGNHGGKPPSGNHGGGGARPPSGKPKPPSGGGSRPPSAGKPKPPSGKPKPPSGNHRPGKPPRP